MHTYPVDLLRHAFGGWQQVLISANIVFVGTKARATTAPVL